MSRTGARGELMVVVGWQQEQVEEFEEQVEEDVAAAALTFDDGALPRDARVAAWHQHKRQMRQAGCAVLPLQREQPSRPQKMSSRR